MPVDEQPLRVHRRAVIAASDAEALYPVYEATFGHLRTRAAARHLLSLPEFVEEMADARIDKYVAETDEGTFLGLSTLARDLAAVPWASPEFYVRTYPEHAARGAIWYLGFTMVDPSAQRGGTFHAMLEEMMVQAREAGVVVGWDACGFNIDETGINDAIVRAVQRGNGVTAEVDRQAYFTVDFSRGPG